jgi:hypothetical protein
MLSLIDFDGKVLLTLFVCTGMRTSVRVRRSQTERADDECFFGLYQSLWVMLRSCIAFSNVDALAAGAGGADLVE